MFDASAKAASRIVARVACPFWSERADGVRRESGDSDTAGNLVGTVGGGSVNWNERSFYFAEISAERTPRGETFLGPMA
jgi:hypothetical protein